MADDLLSEPREVDVYIGIGSESHCDLVIMVTKPNGERDWVTLNSVADKIEHEIARWRRMRRMRGEVPDGR